MTRKQTPTGIRYGAAIRKAMEERQLNQKQLAGLVPCTEAEVSLYLSGRQIPSPPRLEQLAEALGMYPWQLMYRLSGHTPPAAPPRS